MYHKHHGKNSIMYSVPIEINQYNVNSKQFQYLWSFTDMRHLQKSAYLMDEQQHTQGAQNWLYLKAIANQ